MVGSLGCAIDPDILGSIFTNNSFELLDTWLWWVGTYIHSLLSKNGSKKSCFGEVLRQLKKKKKTSQMEIYMRANPAYLWWHYAQWAKYSAAYNE